MTNIVTGQNSVLVPPAIRIEPTNNYEIQYYKQLAQNGQAFNRKQSEITNEISRKYFINSTGKSNV